MKNSSKLLVSILVVLCLFHCQEIDAQSVDSNPNQDRFTATLKKDSKMLEKWQKRRKELAKESKNKFGVWRQWTLEDKQREAALVDTKGKRAVLLVRDSGRKIQGWISVHQDKIDGLGQSRLIDHQNYEKLSKSDKKKFVNNELLVEGIDLGQDPYLTMMENVDCIVVDYHSPEDVEEILGRPPEKKSTPRQYTTWTWSAKGPDFSRTINLSVVFENGIATRVDKSW